MNFPLPSISVLLLWQECVFSPKLVEKREPVIWDRQYKMKRQNLTYNQIFLNQFSLDYLLRSVTGYFQVCLDNTPYRFSGKLVYIYIVTYIMEEWAQYMEEIQSVSLTAQNFSVSKNSLMNKQDVFFKHIFNRRTQMMRLCSSSDRWPKFRPQ